MNLCFSMGKIISEIEFDFVIKEKSIGKHVSVVNFWLDVFGEKINIIGYNNIADFCYQKLAVEENVLIKGIASNGRVEIEGIEII